MRAADTNLLIRLLTGDDPDQARRAEAFVVSGAWIPHIVLVAGTWVLASAYELGRAKIAEAVDMLLDHTSLAVEDPEAVSAALAIYRTNSGVEFSDCLALETARRAVHLPLGTFDRRLGRLPGTELV